MPVSAITFRRFFEIAPAVNLGLELSHAVGAYRNTGEAGDDALRETTLKVSRSAADLGQFLPPK